MQHRHFSFFASQCDCNSVSIPNPMIRLFQKHAQLLILYIRSMRSKTTTNHWIFPVLIICGLESTLIRIKIWLHSVKLYKQQQQIMKTEIFVDLHTFSTANEVECLRVPRKRMEWKRKSRTWLDLYILLSTYMWSAHRIHIMNGWRDEIYTTKQPNKYNDSYFCIHKHHMDSHHTKQSRKRLHDVSIQNSYGWARCMYICHSYNDKWTAIE